jgi:diadenylate cyclase
MGYFIFTFFQAMRWQDVVDIALNSYILFRLYILFRGTNVFRVLLGIASLIFVQRLAVSMGLIVTSWVIQGITAAAALLIIVVFRNEIRSLLQARNVKNILWGFPKGTTETPIEIIADSVYELAQNRTGALLVFPGKEDLEEFIHSGIPWGGQLSREMILSIFWHNNPVHDGAAVVVGNQVKEVGAVLPLSRSKDLPSYYGTRHRAAAGLAENSDALVVVVSEERGKVMVAKGTDTKTVTDKASFIRIMRDHLGLPEEGDRRSRRNKLEFVSAGLVSVFLVSGLWFSFMSGFKTFTTLQVPIQYTNPDPRVQIVNTSANAVSLRLSGSDPLIKSLRPDQVNVTIDLNKASIGANTFAITDESIELPRGVHVSQITPQSVEVTLDVLMEKKFPVQIDWTGKPAGNFVISHVTVRPQKIGIVGPSHVLEKMTTVYTQPVSINNLEKSGKMTVKLALPQALTRLAADFKDSVEVQYTIVSRQK